MKIRFATEADSDAILCVYAPYLDTPISFEDTVPTAEDFRNRVIGISEKYPYLVCEEGGEIVGYAYAHPDRERKAYGWNAELSIYLRKEATGRCIGTALYTALLALLRLQGIKTVYAGVTVPNERSEALHQKMGFRRIGIYYRTGFKCGEWHDVAWFEKQIAPYTDAPSPVIPIKELPEEKIREILK